MGVAVGGTGVGVALGKAWAVAVAFCTIRVTVSSTGSGVGVPVGKAWAVAEAKRSGVGVVGDGARVIAWVGGSGVVLGVSVSVGGNGVGVVLGV